MIRYRAPIVLVTLVLVGACRQAEPPAETAKPAPAAPFEAPLLGVYVTNETSGDLSVIDATTGTVVGVVPLGKRPRGIAVSPDGTTLYVALSGSPPAPPGVDETTLPPPDRTADGIGVVDVRQMKLLKVLPSGTDPEVVAVSHDGTRVFVANEDAAKASVVDVATGAILESFRSVRNPKASRCRPGVDRVWVTSEDDGAVFVIDLPTHKVVASVPVGPRPRSIAFLPDGSMAYVPSENGATVTVVDAKRLKPVKTIKLGDGMRPMGTAMAPDGKFLYVTTGRSKMLLDHRHGHQYRRRLGGSRRASLGPGARGRRQDRLHGERPIQ